MSENVLQQLQEMIAKQTQQQMQTQQSQQSMQMQPMQPFGLPTMQPMGMMAGPMTAMPMMGGPIPQPVGVSVPVTVPLPDGRELSIRVHFGQDAAANLQQFAAMCAQMFGSYLQARNPWGGSGGYQSWNGRSRSNYGRRW
ncbi:MAG: hypothetical protein Kow0040_22850 [Thermogutta sp.]